MRYCVIRLWMGIDTNCHIIHSDIMCYEYCHRKSKCLLYSVQTNLNLKI